MKGVAALLLLSLAACQDLRDFAGRFQGAIVVGGDGDGDPVRVGFDAATTATLDVTAADTVSLVATVTTSDGRFAAAPLLPVRRAAGDALGALDLGDGALRTYLLAATPADGGGAALALVTLREGGHVELRLLRGADDLYGIFRLGR